MKFLKYLLYLILVLVVLFFAVGFIVPSVSYDSTVQVDKSAKEAWAVMSDPANMPKWLDGFLKTELVSGTENTVGAVSNVYFDNNGQEAVIEETVTSVTDYEELGMKFHMDFMDMDYVMLFDEKDGKTTLTSRTTAKGNGMIAKSMVALMKGGMKKQEDTNLASLRDVINSNTKDYYPAPVVEVDSMEAGEDSMEEE